MLNTIFIIVTVIMVLLGGVLDYIRSYHPNNLIEKIMFIYSMALTVLVVVLVILKFIFQGNS